MNMFMHGIEEFSVVRGDTLAQPAFLENDELQRFNVILANPPYSIKSWDQKGFANDPYGRNLWGVPPQGCADYAFEQHIHKSLDTKNGRCAILWPHGILFRDQEKQMRIKMIGTDTVECVIALGKNLFYNSSMESAILIRSTCKEEHKKGKVLFINAFNEIKDEKTIAFLLDSHISKIYNAYKVFKDIPDFAKVITIDEILANDGSLLVTNYIKSSRINDTNIKSVEDAYKDWIVSSEELDKSMKSLLEEMN